MASIVGLSVRLLFVFSRRFARWNLPSLCSGLCVYAGRLFASHICARFLSLRQCTFSKFEYEVPGVGVLRAALFDKAASHDLVIRSPLLALIAQVPFIVYNVPDLDDAVREWSNPVRLAAALKGPRFRSAWTPFPVGLSTLSVDHTQGSCRCCCCCSCYCWCCCGDWH